ncbi:MAG: FecR domain-containing protein [Odoribacteraceae bacterium]|jgi:ferric-dicitrate binding protein FerR (iron transport regulator)|nr:FecR domain-containing protein [Odoribacteraceae bacterium]
MHIEWLIIKRNLEGVASEEERSIYRRWIEADRAHAAYARQVEACYNRLDTFEALSGERLQAKREEFYRLVRRKARLSRARRWTTVAASILVLASIAFLHARRGETGVVNEQCIQPGRSYAELQLADGNVVILQPGEERLIASDARVEITTREKALVYTPRGESAGLKYHVINVPAGAEYEVQLSDGTRVFLNSASRLRFPVAFTGPGREVFLEGEAFFEVARDTTRPFSVRAGEMTVEVLGTSFNTRSYPKQSIAATTLTGGRLRVILPGGEHEIAPGQQAWFDKETRSSGVKEVEVEQYTSWKDGYYYFNRVPLEEIMSTLAAWYNLEVSYQDPGVKSIPFSGQLERHGDVARLLDKFESTNEIQCIIQGNHVIIKKQ